MMASVLLSDVSGIPNFNVSEATGIAERWKRWPRAFELYVAGKGVTDVDQKNALLLHSAGMDVQDVYYTLPDGDGDDAYAKTVSALNKYFKPQTNSAFERSILRRTAQLPNETIEQYITRLRQCAETCDFGNREAVDEQIRDQVIDKCLNHNLRKKLLEKGRTLTLEILRETSKVFEDSARQACAIEAHVQQNIRSGSDTDKVHFVHRKTRSFNTANAKPVIQCFKCGYERHMQSDQNCPARGQKCRKCSGVGHFQKMCKTKNHDKVTGAQGARKKTGKVRQVTEEQPTDDEYTFSVNGVNSVNEKIVVNVENVDLQMIINSGASCNILGRPLWNFLKENRVVCVSSKNTKELYSYGADIPLRVAGTFTATVKCNTRTLDNVEFVVLDGKGQALLSRDTALKLGVLKLINSVTDSERICTTAVTEPKDIFDKYPDAFCGVGKLKSFQLEIPIDPDVEPVVQPLRGIPFNMRDKVEKKLNELLDLDIIEPVNEPSPWVSPVVVVPKRSG
jgi:hypothetical protein